MRAPDRLLVLLLSLATLVTLATCQAPHDRRAEANPLGLRGTVPFQPLEKVPLALPDTRDRVWDFRAETDGEVALLFFGYTFCPDICAIHMATLAAALREVPPEVRRRVATVFVTVDPARDTPERLAGWLAAFDSSFVGLRGTEEEISSALAFYGYSPPETSGEEIGYTVSHPALVYAFTPDGLGRALYGPETPPAVWVHDLPILAGAGAAGTAGAGAGRGAGAAATGAGAGFGASGAGAGAGAGAGGGGGGGAAATAPASVSIRATTVCTATVCPSWTTISASTPAVGAGISASTLSVEISKMGSSRFTASPTFFIHRDKVPSAMDSPIWGMITSTRAMGVFLRESSGFGYRGEVYPRRGGLVKGRGSRVKSRRSKVGGPPPRPSLDLRPSTFDLSTPPTSARPAPRRWSGGGRSPPGPARRGAARRAPPPAAPGRRATRRRAR